MAEATNITEITSKEQFDEAIKSENLTVVDFWATWCPPCRLLKPLLHKIAGEHPEIQLLTVDTEENPDLPTEYEVTNLPTVLFIKNWEIIDSFVGFLPENEILEKIEANK